MDKHSEHIKCMEYLREEGRVGEENKWEAGNKQSYPPLVGVKGKVCKVVQELDAGSQLVHVIMMVII